MDIDVGEEKAETKSGYRTVAEAEAALAHFCTVAGLPIPTFRVNSGGGLHVYFSLDKPVDKVTWQEIAQKLKDSAKTVGFLADPSRTADIASILRVPGTLNHKYSPARQVTLEHASAPIDSDGLLQAINAAHDKLCAKPEIQLGLRQPIGESADKRDPGSAKSYGPPDLTRLASALKALDPDCDDGTWKLHRLAPMAAAAREYPELADELKALARSWSSGELRGNPSTAWTTPGSSNGITGQAAFDDTWIRFFNGPINSQHATIGTIYHDAKKTGWRFGEEAFELLDAETVVQVDVDAEVIPHDTGEPLKVGQEENNRREIATRLDSQTFPDQPATAGRTLPATIPNTVHLLASAGIDVRYNVIAKKLQIKMIGQTGILDNNVALARIQSLAALNGLCLPNLQGFLVAIGDDNQFNPMADWILSKPWDGVDRLPLMHATLVERPGFPSSLKERLLFRWLLSVVAAATKSSGFRSRGVLTLQGPQSIGKTSWIRLLVSDQSLIKLDHHLDPSNRDSLATAVEHSIVEIGELDSSFKKDVARLKGFLTSDTDKFRRPYDRFNSEYPRRTVFCASVNDDNFLVDPTGNTRFWTIPVISIDHAHSIDMQMVYAQLAVALDSGEQWWLTPDEEAELEDQNRNHVAVSALRELLLEKLDLAESGRPSKRMTASQVLKELQIPMPTNAQVRECGQLLKELLGDPTPMHKTNAWPIRFRDSGLGLDPTATLTTDQLFAKLKCPPEVHGVGDLAEIF